MQTGLLLPSFAGEIPKSSAYSESLGQRAAQCNSLASVVGCHRGRGVGDGSIASPCAVSLLSLGFLFTKYVGLRDGRPLWSLMACDPRVSQEISWAGWVGICLGWGSLEKRSLPSSLLSNSGSYSCRCSHPLGARAELGFITLIPSVAFGSHL